MLYKWSCQMCGVRWVGYLPLGECSRCDSPMPPKNEGPATEPDKRAALEGGK